MNVEEIKTIILENKKEHYGEQIGDKTFGGAGEKTIKLCGTVSEDDVFITYEDIANQKGRHAKNIYSYFFKNNEVETIKIEEDFEDEEEELEEIMDGIVFVENTQKLMDTIKIIKTPSFEYHISDMGEGMFDAWKKEVI